MHFIKHNNPSVFTQSNWSYPDYWLDVSANLDPIEKQFKL
jgi:hypothetical protein